MKIKTSSFLFLFSVISASYFTSVVSAKMTSPGSAEAGVATVKPVNQGSIIDDTTQSSPTGRQQITNAPSPTGYSVQNQNQVKTQNQGEEYQLQINTQEKEALQADSDNTSTDSGKNSEENMSEVAKQVQELLEVKTKGGIGEQVREIAKEQNQAQLTIQEQLSKLKSKGKIARLLTGTDRTAVKNLESQVEQNQLRIDQLEKLKIQLSNQGEIETVEQTIQLLNTQNESLQERISLEEKSSGMFGWLLRLFAKQ
ncbi:MAG: hypothetical protein ACOZAN_00795 [Patescibacteria group bacterium]